MLLADPSGLSANKVTQNTADDNECFSNGGGALAGNVINAACLNTPMGSQVVVGFAVTPPPPHWEATVVFANPGQGSGGEDATFESERGARREAFRRYNIPTSLANAFKRLLVKTVRATMAGPNGEPYEEVVATDVNGETQVIEHHNWGHTFTDVDPPQAEPPHYHGPSGEHIFYSN